MSTARRDVTAGAVTAEIQQQEDAADLALSPPQPKAGQRPPFHRVAKEVQMKNGLLYTLCFLVIADIGWQAFTVYRQSSAQPAAMIKAPAGLTLETAQYRLDGKPDAKIAVIEFSDYECPYCLRYASTVFPDLRDRYVKTGQIRYGFVNNPLPIHQEAQLLARAAVCADKQNRFWPMHDALFEKKPRNKDEILKLIADLNIEPTIFEECMADSGTEAQIDRDMKLADHMGLHATPAFAIGTFDSTGHVIIKTIITGAQPLTIFDKAIANAKS
ncbi:MAG TPA: thioredoxin domain-containing protein, partial [Terriglobia bacterium]|nr:thioredoxin domain-containing protein [Terriglobia bacterium]